MIYFLEYNLNQNEGFQNIVLFICKNQINI